MRAFSDTVKWRINVIVICATFVMLLIALFVPSSNAISWREFKECGTRDIAVGHMHVLHGPDSLRRFNDPILVGTMLSNHNITFIGDSIVRYLYYGLRHALDPSLPFSGAKYHSNLFYTNSTHKITLKFLWAPYVTNLSTILKHRLTQRNRSPKEVLIIGNGPWDALHSHDLKGYVSELNEEKERMCLISEGSAKSIWISFGHIVNSKLQSKEKKVYLNERVSGMYRKQVESSMFLHCFDDVVDMNELTKQREESSFDGIHYSWKVYSAAVQVLLNLLG